jgi:hypothetical protein
VHGTVNLKWHETDSKSDMVTSVLFMYTRTFDMLQLVPQNMSKCTMEIEYKASQMETDEVHKKQETDRDRRPYVSSAVGRLWKTWMSDEK